jgi:ABC-type sugar transport system substrate-binding protein
MRNWLKIGLIAALLSVHAGIATSADGKYAPADKPTVKWEKSTFVPSLELPVNLRKKVYYVESFLADVAHLMMVAGSEMAFKQMGWECEVLNPENNLQLQVKMVEDALAKGDMDALIISAVDSEGIASTIKKVSDQGIPVVVVDRWPSDGELLFGVGGDWYVHGSMVAEHLVKLLTEKKGAPEGKVIAILVGMEVNALRDRAYGMRDVMKKYPKIKILEKNAPTDAVKSAQILKDAILANPDVDAIWNIADVFGMNFVEVMKEIGVLYPAGDLNHIILCSMDGTDWAHDEVRNGYFDCTASHQLIEWGYMAGWSLGQYYGGRAAEAIKFGPFAAPGTKWDGSMVIDMGNGPYLGLKSILVTKENVDDPTLWGNRVDEFLK